jgi:hypothetical protein
MNEETNAVRAEICELSDDPRESTRPTDPADLHLRTRPYPPEQTKALIAELNEWLASHEPRRRVLCRCR